MKRAGIISIIAVVILLILIFLLLKFNYSKSNDIKEGTGLKEKPGPKTDRRSVPSQNQYVQNAYQKIRIVNLKQAGRSATDDSALMKFLVTAN